jgi:predicted phosphohydrolase
VDLFSTRGIHGAFTIAKRSEFFGKSDVGESEKKSKNWRHTGAGRVAIFMGKREACGM